jgi:hypothetical protein
MSSTKEKSNSEKSKMTLYISKPTAKEFKKLAVDLEKDYSELADLAFQEYVQNHKNDNQSDQS